MTLMNVVRELLGVALTHNASTQKALTNVHAREDSSGMRHTVVSMCPACVPMAQFVIEMLFVSMLVEIATGM